MDVIDSPRGGSSYIPPPLQLNEGPTSSVVSLTNCDKIVTSSEVLLDQSVEESSTYGQEGQEAQDIVGSRTKPRAKTLTPKISSEFTDKSKPKSFTFQDSNESIRKPLVEEDKL